MKFIVLLFTYIFYYFALSVVKGDIPTHCLKSQVVGKWIFTATKTQKYNINNLYNLKCGIADHTSETSIIASSLPEKQFIEQFTITLNQDSTANYITKDGKDIVNLYKSINK